jgi:hypothetical protein
MNTFKILYALRNVHSFSGVYPPDILPLDKINQTGTIILNPDPHRERFTLARFPHWTQILNLILCRQLWPTLFVPAIQSFLRRTCTIWEYNKTQLQGLTTVCRHYWCLLALYMDGQYTPKGFITLCNTHADRHVREMFRSEFGIVKCSSMGISPPTHVVKKAWAFPPNL